MITDQKALLGRWIFLLAAFALPMRIHAQEKASAPYQATDALVKHALECIGLDRANVIVDGTELKPADHFLPFASGRDAILRIHVKNFKLTQKDGKYVITNPYIHSLNIFYSENAGQVVEIVSAWPRGVKVIPFSSVKDQEKSLKADGRSFSWASLAVPRVKPMKALQAPDRISDAEQIIVYYTLFSDRFTWKRPAWIIVQRGLPETPVVPPPGTSLKMPEEFPRDEDWLGMVDARTGKEWFDGTCNF
jgi:hypothetical protein